MSDTNNPRRTPSEKLTLEAFGKTIRQLREQRGYSQEEFAYIAGFSRSYYTEIETGKRNPSLLNIIKIAKALNVNVGEIMNFSQAENNG